MPDENQTSEEANLRALGVQADADSGENTESPTVEAQTEQPSKDAPESQPDAEATKSADTPAVHKPTEPDKPLSEYEKAKKAGKEREARAWEKIEQEKTAIAKEKAEVEQRKREVEERQRQAEPEEKYGPEDYEGYAKNLRQQAQKLRDEQADYTGAEQLEQEAAGHEQHAGKLRHRLQQDAESFRGQWLETAAKEGDAEPAFKDLNTPLAKAAKAVLEAQPWLYKHPQGFAFAAQQAKQQIAAAEVPALKSQIQKLTQENERLTKLTSPRGSGPTQTQQVASSVDQMSERDGEKYLRRLASEQDAA